MATKTIYKVKGQDGGYFRVQDIDGVGHIDVDGIQIPSPEVIAATADVTLTAATHAGKVVTLGSATGDTATLPAATGTGNVYTVVVAVTATSNNHIIQAASATDIMQGVVWGTQDSADTVVGWETAADSDTITMNGTTKGGYVGDKHVLIDIAAGVWQLSGFMKQTGTEATPLSAAVS